MSDAPEGSGCARWASQPEKELAAGFRHKAEAVENAGFHRLADILRSSARGHEKDAARILS